jgi:hypothetical protein
MSNVGRNQEVVKKFLASKAFDFAAFGKFVAENGASLASSEDSEFGFIIGNHVIRYCIMRSQGINSYEGVEDLNLLPNRRRLQPPSN